jgi:hypothetical protein
MRTQRRRFAVFPSLAIAVASAGLARAADLPDPPVVSPRNANYSIDARLDASKHTIDGTLVLDWRNTTGIPLSTFPFHLYWNAFRNTRSTSARGDGPRAARFDDTDRGFGYTDVRAIRLLADHDVDLMPTLRYLHPDDANTDTSAAKR